MEPQLRSGEALTSNHFDSIRRVCQNVRQRRTLRRSEVSQHVVCRGLTTRGPTDADAHADEVTRADRRDDVAQAIVPAVPTTLPQSNLPGLELIHRGKVRDVYALDDQRLLMVATDRLSAFDVVMPNPIPGKGEMLTQISNFWFGKTAHLVPNHLLDVPLAEVLPPGTDLNRSSPRPPRRPRARTTRTSASTPSRT